MKITKVEEDIAGKYRVWVEIETGQERMLKFDSEVSDEEAIAEMQRIIDITA